MQNLTKQSKSNEVSPVRWIFGGLTLITLYFQTNLYDPFNSPKMWILFFTAGWLVGYLISFKQIIFDNKSLKILLYLILAFIISALLATMFTPLKFTAIFGEIQRRNGFISYLSLAIIMLTTAVFVRSFNIIRLYAITFLIGTISAIYAYMQTTGRDFVEWNNTYNSIIGTLGNPNFAAALLAVMGVLIFSSIFISDLKVQYRFFAAVLTVVLLGLIYRSEARQGLLSYSLGVGIFVVIWIGRKNRKLGVVAAGSGVLIFIFSILGMLQIGPLERFLYKPTVTVRGYYWRAGIEMFKQNPLFGVGMDRYGAYFKQVREIGYPLTHGFELTSSNAHNTFIQLFATGGIFFGLSYLILNFYIIQRAFIGYKNLTGNNQVFISGVFSAWVAFQAQSLVSIDNIGISIWGWILGGSIIGLSLPSNSLREGRNQFIGRKSDINLLRLFASTVPTLMTVILISMLYQGETRTFKAMSDYNLQDQTNLAMFKNAQLEVIKTPLIDPNYSLRTAYRLIQAGFTEDGIVAIKKIYANDPRNLEALLILASACEQNSRIPEAIIYREKIAYLDQWNAPNYLQLGRNYKLQGDLTKSKQTLDKLLSFATGLQGGPWAEQAKKELTQ